MTKAETFCLTADKTPLSREIYYATRYTRASKASCQTQSHGAINQIMIPSKRHVRGISQTRKRIRVHIGVTGCWMATDSFFDTATQQKLAELLIVSIEDHVVPTKLRRKKPYSKLGAMYAHPGLDLLGARLSAVSRRKREREHRSRVPQPRAVLKQGAAPS